MKYYSNRIFYFLIAMYILAALAALLYWQASSVFACWTLTGAECLRIRIKLNIFGGVIPLSFFVLSGLVIMLQQKSRKRFGYFMVPLAAISSFYIGYLLKYVAWSDIEAIFFVSDRLILYNLLFSAMGIISFVAALLPFYVLGKLIKQDFFKKQKIAK